jgi:hypothetical protein
MPVNNRFFVDGMTACGRCRPAFGSGGRLVGLLYGCTERYAFGFILNCAAEHTIYLFSKGILSYVYFDNAFLDQFLLVFCVALCRLIV